MIIKNKATASIFKVVAIYCMLISCSASGPFKAGKSDVSEIVSYIAKIDSDTSLTRVENIGDCSEEALLKNPNCGFETIKSFGANSKLLYKIIHKEYGDSTMNHCFYFKDNKLVYALAEKAYLSNEKSVLVYKSKIYLKDYKVVEESRINKRLSSIQLIQIGESYLKAHHKIYPE